MADARDAAEGHEARAGQPPAADLDHPAASSRAATCGTTRATAQCSLASAHLASPTTASTSSPSPTPSRRGPAPGQGPRLLGGGLIRRCAVSSDAPPPRWPWRSACCSPAASARCLRHRAAGLRRRATARPSWSRPPTGSGPPTSRGTTLDGEPFDLASLRGQVVVLNVWASWCAPCRAEGPMLQSVHADLRPRACTFVGHRHPGRRRHGRAGVRAEHRHDLPERRRPRRQRCCWTSPTRCRPRRSPARSSSTGTGGSPPGSSARSTAAPADGAGRPAGRGAAG